MPHLDTKQLIRAKLFSVKMRLPKKIAAMFRRAGKIGGKIGGSKGGKIGGPARAAKLTPEQRSAIAKKAAAARWGKGKAKKAGK